MSASDTPISSLFTPLHTNDIEASRNQENNRDPSLINDSLVTEYEDSSNSLEIEIKKIKEVTETLTATASENLKKYKTLAKKNKSQSQQLVIILEDKTKFKSHESEDLFKSKSEYSPVPFECVSKSETELSQILLGMQVQLRGLQEKYESQTKSLERINEVCASLAQLKDTYERPVNQEKNSNCNCTQF